jgi:hypothetical protein
MELKKERKRATENNSRETTELLIRINKKAIQSAPTRPCPTGAILLSIPVLRRNHGAR